MKRTLVILTTNCYVLVIISCAWLILSFVFSIKTGQWLWFQRSGGFVVCFGALLSIRRLVRLGLNGLFIHENTIDGGHATQTPEERESDRQLKLDISAMHFGFIMLLIGTLVCSYGDLLGQFRWL